MAGFYLLRFKIYCCMVSLFIDENTSRLEYVWINYGACFFECVYVVRDYVHIVKVLPNKPPCDLRNVSCNDWFTSKKGQNLLAKCIKILWKCHLPLCSVKAIMLRTVIYKCRQLQGAYYFYPRQECTRKDLLLGQSCLLPN